MIYYVRDISFANRMRWLLLLMALMLADGCAAPKERLEFPTQPIDRNTRGLYYDIHHRAKADFALLADEQGKFDILAYDDAGSGDFNRKYRLSEYANEDVPHLIILLDSIPYQKFADAHAAGRFPWFDPPVKVIPPFPSMTELIFSRILDAPPLPGMIDQYYDRETGKLQNNLWKRIGDQYEEPWERRLHYTASMYESGLMYLDPRPWFGAELERAKKTFDESPDRVTLVYFSSASAMLSRYGEAGLNEVIDGVERLCLKTLYERQGAVKISICADHGHNLMPSKNIAFTEQLKAAGFNPTNTIVDPNDIVMEINGLVTYAAIRTLKPAEVAHVIAADPRIELTTYIHGQRVVVETNQGTAAIESRHHKVRYVPIRGDALGYVPIIESLRAANKMDADGFASDADWFAATLDHEFPDAPRRLWDAYHGMVVNTPEVMLVARDGYCIGEPEFQKYIHMASTHGGLNQINSATFLMSMTGRVKGPLKSRDILPTIEPGYEPLVRRAATR